MHYKFIINILIVVTYLKLGNSQNYLCSDEFCKTYTEQHECMPLGSACTGNKNETSGEIFPGEVPCGCCAVCMEHIKEGEYCTIGAPDSAPPMMVCGPGLTCKEETKFGEIEHRCRKMDTTPCYQDQIAYDKIVELGNIGKFMERPKCDGDGNYPPTKCNPGQTCFCVDNDGNRIFGESLYSTKTELTMKCECSKMNDKFHKLINFKNPILTSRCLSNGNYDPMQCMGDECICVEEESGFPIEKSNYNITLISYDKLPCYNRSLHLDYKYLHDCEYIKSKILDDIHESGKNNFQIYDRNNQNCQPDGWFNSVSQNQTTKFCVDNYNRKMDNFEAPIDSTAAKNMNCNCARTRYLLKKNGIKILPNCQLNGNFEKIQCRDNICYCVDSDGLQVGKEVPQDEMIQLKC